MKSPSPSQHIEGIPMITSRSEPVQAVTRPSPTLPPSHPAFDALLRGIHATLGLKGPLFALSEIRTRSIEIDAVLELADSEDEETLDWMEENCLADADLVELRDYLRRWDDLLRLSIS
jgi:hypothetical protein